MEEIVDLDNLGIVYVLTNPAMPGLVKIGKTSRGDVNARLGELYSTGVPVPFECAFAGRIADEGKVEKAFHMAFGPYRLNPKREFFEIEPAQAIALLELLVEEDITPQLQKEAENVDIDSKAATDKLKSRRPVLNFLEMGIPVGSELQFGNGEQVCTVLNGRRVEYQGADYSLTGLTKILLDTDTQVRPTPQWTYQGRSLNDIYNETYGHL